MNAARLVDAGTRALLSQLLGRFEVGELELVVGDGSVRVGRGEPFVAVRWSTRATRRVLSAGLVGFGDGYVEGDWVVEQGSLRELLTLLLANGVHHRVKALVPRPAASVRGLARRFGDIRRLGARDARFHYDVDAEFYALWLDESMTYTCGFARTPTDSLAAMQANKLALVLDKLGVGPGQRLLDLGCGWGSLAEAAARRGASVTAVNVSERQLDWIRASGRIAGLDVNLRLADFRDIEGQFDRVTAIGIAEHVGQAHLTDLFSTVAGRLRDGGLALVHTIGDAVRGEVDPWIERRIFPGSYVPALSELVAAAEANCLRVCHIENLGRHYALTLEHWRRRLVDAREPIEARYGAATFRAWELYLTGLVPAFERLSTSLFQLVLSKGEAANPELGLRTHFADDRGCS